MSLQEGFFFVAVVVLTCSRATCLEFVRLTQPDGYREVDHDPLLPLLEGCIVRIVDHADDDGFYYGRIEGAIRA